MRCSRGDQAADPIGPGIGDKDGAAASDRNCVAEHGLILRLTSLEGAEQVPLRVEMDDARTGRPWLVATVDDIDRAVGGDVDAIRTADTFAVPDAEQLSGEVENLQTRICAVGDKHSPVARNGDAVRQIELAWRRPRLAPFTQIRPLAVKWTTRVLT